MMPTDITELLEVACGIGVRKRDQGRCDHRASRGVRPHHELPPRTRHRDLVVSQFFDRMKMTALGNWYKMTALTPKALGLATFGPKP
jgi:hypothetical protein